MENPRNFLRQSFGTNGSQSHGGDLRAHLHPSDVLAFKHVPFWLVGSELHLPLLWSVVDSKGKGITGICCANSVHA